MSKKRLATLLCCLTLLVQLSSAKNALLPRDLMEGWTGLELEEYVSGSDLFVYMNGGAELYLEYRYAGLSVREYTDESGNSLSVEIYNFATPEDAYGIFSVDTTGTPLDVGQGGRRTKVAARFWKDRHYVRAFVWVSKPELADAPETAARAVAARIEKESPLPGWLDLLVRADARPVFIRGDIALRQVAGSWQPKELPITRKGGAAWIPPREKSPAAALIFNYPDDRSCSRSFQQIWDAVIAEARSYAVVANRGLANRSTGTVDGLEKVANLIIWVPRARDEAACGETLDAIKDILSAEGGEGE
jgi:hypothetical protein